MQRSSLHQSTTRALFLVCLLVVGALMLWLPVAARAATYAYRNDVFSYDTPSAAAKTVAWHTSGASPGCTTYPDGDDDFADITFASATVPANNFTFTFNGVVQTGARIYSNGMIVFGTDTSGFHRTFTNTTLPITAQAGAFTGCTRGVPSQMIIPYWTDIVAGTANATTGASVQYELLGTAPNRRLVISWVNVKLYNATARYNFQVLLYESPAGGLNSNFKFQYTTGSSTGSAATVGVQVNTTDYTLYSFNQAFIDPVAGSAILWYPANQLASRLAEYHLDEGAWNGTAGEIEDTSGSNDGVRIGTAASVAGGKVCRGGSIPANTSNTVIDAIATPVSPTSVGSIDFWFNSNVRWNTSDAMLFDAGASAARPFYLMKTATGALKFVVADSSGTLLTATSAAQTFSAGSWQHIGVSWNLRPGTNQTVLQVFLNGSLVTTLRTTSTGSISASNTFYLGDNRLSGTTPSGGTPNSANGILDEVNIYPTEINASQATVDLNTTRTTCLSLNHFHIIHAGSVVNCGNIVTPVTIEAHDVNHNLFTLSGTTITLTTSTGHGTWSTVAGGSINPVIDSGLANGTASYTFSGESKITVGLSNAWIESANINVAAGVYTERSGTAATCVSQDYTSGSTCDGDLTFESAGFRFVDASGNLLSVNQRSGAQSGTFFLQAVKSSCTTPGTCSGACTALFPPGTPVSVGLAFECSNPSTCVAGQSVTFTPGSGAGSATTISGNAAGAVSGTSGTYTSAPLTFNATALSAAVPFTFSYSDAGRIRLWARYPAGGGSTAIVGNSGNIVAAPARFVFSGTTAGPIRAGVNFGTTVTAVNTTGATTPNFGQESPKATLTLTHQKCQPTGTGAVNGNFNGAATPVITSGAAQFTTLNWSDVGNLDLNAALTGSSYLASGQDVRGSTAASGTSCSGAGSVGPFVPDHFDTVVTPACNTTSTVALNRFSYSGQPFATTIVARNLAGAVTANFDGSGALTPSFATNVTLTDANALGTGTLSSATVPATAFVAGIATATPRYTFATKATAPGIIRIRASNGTSVSAVTEGTTAIRTGRVRVSNAYGSEKLALTIPATIQYFDGAAWVSNIHDACTVLNASNIRFAFGGTGNRLAACETAVTVGGTRPDFQLRLSAPGLGNDGWALLTVLLGTSTPGPSACTAVGSPTTASSSNQDWLQYFWSGPSGSGDPSGLATFGVTRKAPVVYGREVF